MTRYGGLVALLAMVIGLSGSPAHGDEAATGKAAEKVSEPELDLAAAVAKKVDRDELAWRDLTDKLRKAVEGYNPTSLHIMPEGQSLEAFRQYCGKLLDSGRALVALYEKWDKASAGLGDSLRKAPAYYRSASKAMKDKAGTMKFPTIRQRYQLAADVWEQLAVEAERRSKDLSLEQGSKSVVNLLREEVTFLEDFCKTLDALPRVSGEEGGRYDQLVEAFRKHSERSDELERQLKLFRDKLKAGPQPGSGSK